MAELLGVEGYDVVSAKSFDEALALVARHKKLRLVITDARQPRLRTGHLPSRA